MGRPIWKSNNTIIMKQYFYIPRHYEAQIASEIDIYLNSGGDFTIITGVYKTFEGTVDNTINAVYSRLITGDIQTIKNNFFNYIDNLKYDLVGFCMEGNFQVEVPDLYAQIQALPDCYIFNTANEYLEFIKTI